MAALPKTIQAPEPWPPDDPPVAPPRMTESEFVAWSGGFEHVRAEWVDGEVVVMSPANIWHSDLADFLKTVLRIFTEERNLGRVFGEEYFVRFEGGGRLQRRLPDVLFVSRDREHLFTRTYLDGPPDLAVEVVSPDSVDRDRREKFAAYESGGVREYWIIDPEAKTLEAYRLDGGRFARVLEADGRVASAALPGFFLRPDWLWREPLPKVLDVLRELGV